jgi:amino acid transporter
MNTPSLARTLGVWDAAAIAASSTAATTSIGIGVGAIAAVVGGQTPLLLLLAFLPILGIAVAYTRLNRVEPNCGNGYVWVGRSLNPWLGFLAGWITLVSSLIFLAYTSSIAGSVIMQFANAVGLTAIGPLALDPNSTLLSTVIGLGVLAGVTHLAVTGIRRAARMQGALLVVEYAVLVVFCVWGIVVGTQPFTWSWFNPFEISSPLALVQGLVLAVFFFWGFDVAFTTTEESRDPAAVGCGGMIALVAMLGLFLLGSVAFLRMMSVDELIANGPQALTHLGSRLTATPWALAPLLALMFSVVASLLAGLIPTARGLLAMGRDRTMGPVWTRIDPRHGTPAVGTVLVAGTAAGLAVLSLIIPKLNEMVLAAVLSVGTLVATYYGLTALACAARFRSALRAGWRRALAEVVVPAVSGTVLLGLGLVLVVEYALSTDHFAVSVDNGWFLLTVPIVLVTSGAVMAAVARWGRRSSYFRTGRGTDADTVALTPAVSA